MKKHIVISALALLAMVTSCGGEKTSSTTNLHTATTTTTNTPAATTSTTTSISYQIDWVVDGNILKSDIVLEGQTPEYKGANPTKDDEADYYYVFTGWDKEIQPASKNEQYNAVFDKKSFINISFVDINGSLIEKVKVKEGEIPSIDYKGTTDTVEYDYTFTGWSTTANGEAVEISPASEDTTYYEVSTKVKQKYNVELYYNGSKYDTVRFEYGTSVTEEMIPEFDQDSSMQFVAWCTDSECKEAVNFPMQIEGNVKLYAAVKEKIDLTSMLTSLLEITKYDIYGYIPDSLKPASYLATSQSKNLDFTSFVNVSNIDYQNTFGEQWGMVLDNLDQTQSLISVLKVVSTVFDSSVSAFEVYLDSNPNTENSYTFAVGEYDVNIVYEDGILAYSLAFTANVPLLGSQTVNLLMAFNSETQDRICRIQLGESNVMKYTVSKNMYTFGLTLANIRDAYFEIARDFDGNISGHIYEYLTIANLGVSNSCCDFYTIGDDLVVVGNKASGMLISTNEICELYSISTGSLVGYEVKEDVKGIVYNTLWYDLSNVNGITNIKAIAKDDLSVTNPNSIYVNNSSTIFETKNMGLSYGLKIASRRFDIEMRTRYTYEMVSGKLERVELSLPMLFVQQEVVDSLASDVNSSNSSLNINLSVSNEVQNKLITYYTTLIPAFENNKELVTREIINEYVKSIFYVI